MPIQLNVMAARLIAWLLLLHGVLYMPLHADDGDARLFQTATAKIQDVWFRDCIIKFDFKDEWSIDNAPYKRDIGRLVFARAKDAVFCDACTQAESFVKNSDGYPVRIGLTNQQIYKKKGKPELNTYYQLDGSKPVFGAVGVDRKNSDERSFHRIATYVYLPAVLGSFSPLKESLAELTRSMPLSSVRSDGIIKTGTYITKYGPIQISLQIINNEPFVTRVRITRPSSAIFSSPPNKQEPKVGEIDSVWGRYKVSGLTSHEMGFQINYEHGDNKRPFASIVTDEIHQADGKTWKIVETLKVTEYHRIHDDSAIQPLRLPIPEGSSVISSDSELKPLALVNRGGEIVREIDGASLQDVVLEQHASSRRFWWLLAGAIIALGLGIGYYFWQRSDRNSPQRTIL